MANEIAALNKLMTATGAVSTQDGEYAGYVVSVVTAVGSIILYDNATAASGPILDVIPAATAVGASRNLGTRLRVKNGIFADYVGGATGSVTFFYN